MTFSLPVSKPSAGLVVLLPLLPVLSGPGERLRGGMFTQRPGEARALRLGETLGISYMLETEE